MKGHLIKQIPGELLCKYELYSPELIQLFLDEGCDPLARSSFGETPIYTAIYAFKKIIGLSRKDIQKSLTPLLNKVRKMDDRSCEEALKALSSYELDTEFMELLIEKGAKVDVIISSDEKNTLLMKSISNGWLSLSNFLIDHGCDIHRKDRLGHTALTYATQLGHKELAEKLIAKGAEIEPAFGKCVAAEHQPNVDAQ